MKKSTRVVKAQSRTRTRSRRAPKHLAATAREIAALKFEGIPVDLQNFNEKWDQSRGFMARCAAGIARMNDKEMEKKFSDSAESAHAFMDIYDALQREISYLKTHTKMLDIVSVRMLAVAHRFDPNLKRVQRPQLSVVVDNTRRTAP